MSIRYSQLKLQENAPTKLGKFFLSTKKLDPGTGMTVETDPKDESEDRALVLVNSQQSTAINYIRHCIR
jgi:hypothetical protein